MTKRETAEEAAPIVIDATLPEGPVERACRMLSELALVVMIVLIVSEMIARGGFNYSFEVVDEVGAYLLVALTFLSLPVCLASNAFHRVEFVLVRLAPRGRIVARMVFTTLILLFTLVLDFYLARVVLQSYEQEAMAMTRLLTPFWIPQLSMPIGLSALAFTLCRCLLRYARLLRQPEPV